MTSFSNAPWSSPESDLSADDYCSVCLIDENAKGAPKVKDKCKLPVRSKPGAPVNLNAVHAAAGAHGVQGVSAPAEAKRHAAGTLLNYYDDAGEDAPDSLYRIAGKKPPAKK